MVAMGDLVVKINPQLVRRVVFDNMSTVATLQTKLARAPLTIIILPLRVKRVIHTLRVLRRIFIRTNRIYFRIKLLLYQIQPLRRYPSILFQLLLIRIKQTRIRMRRILLKLRYSVHILQLIHVVQNILRAFEIDY